MIYVFQRIRSSGATSVALNLALLHKTKHPQDDVALMQVTSFPDLHLFWENQPPLIQCFYSDPDHPLDDFSELPKAEHLYIDLHLSTDPQLQIQIINQADKHFLIQTPDPSSQQATQSYRAQFPKAEIILNQGPKKSPSEENFWSLPWDEKAFVRHTYGGPPAVLQKRSAWSKALLPLLHHIIQN